VWHIRLFPEILFIWTWVVTYLMTAALALLDISLLVFFVYSYSHKAYLDYGGALFIQVPRLLFARGSTLQASLCPPPGLSQEDTMRTKEITK